MANGSRSNVGAGHSSPLIAELETAHSKLLDAMDALDRLTRGPPPEKGELVDTRWKVSSASLARRLLWGRIATVLSGRGRARENDQLRRLHAIDNELVKTSTKHVNQWTVDAILSNWDGYCSASRDVRSKMAAAIASERDILVPLLRTLD